MPIQSFQKKKSHPQLSEEKQGGNLTKENSRAERKSRTSKVIPLLTNLKTAAENQESFGQSL